jgi:hypothetical protein
MDGTRQIAAAHPELLRTAARQRGWRSVLAELGLEATDANVRAFRRRAMALKIDVTHLRWRPGLHQISSAELRTVVAGASSCAEVVRRLGLRPGGETYRALAEACSRAGVPLPSRIRQAAGTARLSTCSDDEVRSAFAASRSLADLMRRLGLAPKGGNYRVMKQRLRRLGLDPDQLHGQGWATGVRHAAVPITELLVAGRWCPNALLKRRLIEEGLFEASCAGCELVEWLGRPIPLELDHINGDRDDNRLDNLRLLCPNCHALTPTYRGRNVRRRRTLVLAPEC